MPGPVAFIAGDVLIDEQVGVELEKGRVSAQEGATVAAGRKLIELVPLECVQVVLAQPSPFRSLVEPEAEADARLHEGSAYLDHRTADPLTTRVSHAIQSTAVSAPTESDSSRAPTDARARRRTRGKNHTQLTPAITLPSGVSLPFPDESMRSNYGTGGHMTNLHIGDCVMFRDRAYLVRGMSPMGVETRRIQLEDVDTGERVEASIGDIYDDALGNGQSSDSTDPARQRQLHATREPL